MKSCDIYVISWFGQHQNAIEIAEQLRGLPFKVTIIYSDPDSECQIKYERSIRRPNDLFWGDKFKACIDDSDSDLILVIHADCVVDSWRKLATRAVEVLSRNSQIGVWAPYIEWPSKPPRATFINAIKPGPFIFSAWTDSLIFALRRPIVERMKAAKYEENIYGWGICYMFMACALSFGQLTIVDTSLKVIHKPGRGYPSDKAANQREEFLKQLTPAESTINNLLYQIIERNKYILKMESKADLL